jgi:uncharacterized membrane protein YfcA
MFIEGEFLILFLLFMIALLYSSVGHGGASGYLAILSLTIYAEYDSGWLKQHAWALNLVVAAVAFYHYKKAGFFNLKLTLPFILASIPFAILGGYMKVDGFFYDTLLSITLVWAAYKLLQVKEGYSTTEFQVPALRYAIPHWRRDRVDEWCYRSGWRYFLITNTFTEKMGRSKNCCCNCCTFYLG